MTDRPPVVVKTPKIEKHVAPSSPAAVALL